MGYYDDTLDEWVWASEITQEIEDTVDGKVSTITIGADQVNISGNINLDDTMDIENGEVAFYGDIYQGFVDGYFYQEVEISKGHGNDPFYGYPHIELNDYMWQSSHYYTSLNYSRLSPKELLIVNTLVSYGGETSVKAGTIEVTDSNGTVTIEGNSIIISDGTHTKTITATS